MEKCKYGNRDKNNNFRAPCMDFDPAFLYSKMLEMPLNNDVRMYYNTSNGQKKIFAEKINIVARPTKKKITMPIIVQDEEKNLPKFIENVINHPVIGRVIAIDGGSKDNTVKLLEKAGAEVYTHPYIKTYFNQQAMQREISFSYVPDGEKCIYMDIDECFSRELYEWLYEFAESNIDYGLLSRRTYLHYSDAVNGINQIKNYPDWQPRLYTWNKKYKFVNGAHHITINTPDPMRIQKDILHFEAENKDRDKIERQWAGMMQGVRGLNVR